MHFLIFLKENGYDTSKALIKEMAISFEYIVPLLKFAQVYLYNEYIHVILLMEPAKALVSIKKVNCSKK